jgi:hypothetical protein
MSAPQVSDGQMPSEFPQNCDFLEVTSLGYVSARPFGCIRVIGAENRGSQSLWLDQSPGLVCRPGQ